MDRITPAASNLQIAPVILWGIVILTAAILAVITAVLIYHWQRYTNDQNIRRISLLVNFFVITVLMLGMIISIITL